MPRLDPHRLPRHVAIIPDGNGRWAEARGLTRLEEGHRRGQRGRARNRAGRARARRARCSRVYAFSTENWERPRDEVEAIMALLDLLRWYIVAEADELHSQWDQGSR